jgi:hypothetical protein
VELITRAASLGAMECDETKLLLDQNQIKIMCQISININNMEKYKNFRISGKRKLFFGTFTRQMLPNP